METQSSDSNSLHEASTDFNLFNSSSILYYVGNRTPLADMWCYSYHFMYWFSPNNRSSSRMFYRCVWKNSGLWRRNFYVKIKVFLSSHVIFAQVTTNVTRTNSRVLVKNRKIKSIDYDIRVNDIIKYNNEKKNSSLGL